MAEALLMWLLREGSSGWRGSGSIRTKHLFSRSETNRIELMNNEADDSWGDDDGGR